MIETYTTQYIDTQDGRDYPEVTHELNSFEDLKEWFFISSSFIRGDQMRCVSDNFGNTRLEFDYHSSTSTITFSSIYKEDILYYLRKEIFKKGFEYAKGLLQEKITELKDQIDDLNNHISEIDEKILQYEINEIHIY